MLQKSVIHPSSEFKALFSVQIRGNIKLEVNINCLETPPLRFSPCIIALGRLPPYSLALASAGSLFAASARDILTLHIIPLVLPRALLFPVSIWILPTRFHTYSFQTSSSQILGSDCRHRASMRERIVFYLLRSDGVYS